MIEALKVWIICFGSGYPVAPTEEQMQAHYDAEDARGIYGEYSSPMDVYEWDVEWIEKFSKHSLWFLLRWKVGIRSCKPIRRLLLPNGVPLTP